MWILLFVAITFLIVHLEHSDGFPKCFNVLWLLHYHYVNPTIETDPFSNAIAGSVDLFTSWIVCFVVRTRNCRYDSQRAIVADNSLITVENCQLSTASVFVCQTDSEIAIHTVSISSYGTLSRPVSSIGRNQTLKFEHLSSESRIISWR